MLQNFVSPIEVSPNMGVDVKVGVKIKSQSQRITVIHFTERAKKPGKKQITSLSLSLISRTFLSNFGTTISVTHNIYDSPQA